MPPLSIVGYDYSFARPDPAALKQAGGKYVLRYIAPDSPSAHPKILFKPELQRLWSIGLAVGLVYETTAGRADLGPEAGKQDARTANGLAVALGLKDAPIYFACDTDQVTSAQFQAALGYYKGVESVLGHQRSGAYAEYDLIDLLVRNKVCSLYWQPAAWSRGLVHPAADIYQRRNGLVVGGGSVDLNVAATGGFFGCYLNGNPYHGHVDHTDRRKLGVWLHHLHETLDVLRSAKLSSVARAELQAYAAILRGLVRRGGVNARG